MVQDGPPGDTAHNSQVTYKLILNLALRNKDFRNVTRIQFCVVDFPKILPPHRLRSRPNYNAAVGVQGLSTNDSTIQWPEEVGSANCLPDVARVGACEEHKACSNLNRLSSTPDRGVQPEIFFALLCHGRRATIGVRMSLSESYGAIRNTHQWSPNRAGSNT